MAGVARAQGGGGGVHDVGVADGVEHRDVVVVVAEGHDLGRIDAERRAELFHPDALVRKRRVNPVRAGNRGVRLFPARDKPVGKFRHAAGQIDADLDNLLRHIGRVADDGIPVADLLNAVQHAKAALHQVAAVFAREHDLAAAFAALPHIAGDFLGQGAGHRRFGQDPAVLADNAAVFAQVDALVGHRRKQFAQACILPAAGRAEQHAPPRQRPDLGDDLFTDRVLPVGQQRAVQVAAYQSDCHSLFPSAARAARLSVLAGLRVQCTISHPPLQGGGAAVFLQSLRAFPRPAGRLSLRWEEVFPGLATLRKRLFFWK